MIGSLGDRSEGQEERNVSEGEKHQETALHNNRIILRANVLC